MTALNCGLQTRLKRKRFASAQTAELGEPFELAAGLTVAVTAMEVRGDDAGSGLQLLLE